jgi:hypothetical protein
MGSGKSLYGTTLAKRKYRGQKQIYDIRKVFKCFSVVLWFIPKVKAWGLKKDTPPTIYSNIPIRLSGGFLFFKLKLSTPLTLNHILGVSKLPIHAITFIDEIGDYASQWSYNNPNVLDNIKTFIRFYRHQTKGGYLIMTEQATSNIAKEIRSRIGSTFNLLHHHHFLFVHWLEERNITISDEVQGIEEGNNNSSLTAANTYFLANPFIRSYDTYIYYNLYSKMCLESLNNYTNKK